MVTKKKTLEDLLMPLAERTLEPEAGEGLLRRYDPRFDALRKDSSVVVPSPRGSSGAWWELDISLGAIVRVVGACGMYIAYLGQDYTDGAKTWGSWGCTLGVRADNRNFFQMANGETPEEAVAEALGSLLREEAK